MDKPHKGKLINAKTVNIVGGYVYVGTFVDHPQFGGKYGHTSLVVKDDCEKMRHNGDSYEIETLNSRYTICPKVPPNADQSEL